jgi:hypothetical protein
VSGVNTHKLLGAPALPLKSSESAGKLISDQAMLLLDKWKCSEQIASVVFDTTASNTGQVTAGCVSSGAHIQNLANLFSGLLVANMLES